MPTVQVRGVDCHFEEAGQGPAVIIAHGASAISLLTQLTRESFSLAGMTAPSTPRWQWPVRFVRRQR